MNGRFRLNTTKLALTWPRCDADLQSVMDQLKAKLPDHLYVLVCREAHKDGGLHVHGAVLLSKRQDIKDPNFLDICHDYRQHHGNYQAGRSFDRWVMYVRKHGNTLEEGTYVTADDRKTMERKEKNQILASKRVHEAVDDGIISFMHADNFRKAKLAYAQSKRIENSNYNKDRQCVWIYGPPGCGKSAWVRQEYGHDLYYKTPDKWWDSYEGQRNVILEDLDITKSKELVMLLKLWSDMYNFSGECKGGRMFMDYTGFYVTSNFLPEELWKDDMLSKAISRRFKFFTTCIEDSEEFSVSLIPI